ncbi:MAG: retropepsin-like aspartic protease, partial [Vicinamibacterales bacterium]
MRRLVGAILVVAMLPAPAGGSDGRTMAIEVARLPGGLLTVPVEVNAAGPLHLLLDTGSTRTMVTPAAAARLGLAVTAGARVVTPAGTREAGESLIGRLRFGPVTVTGLPVVVAPLDAIDAGGLPLDGVLGADVLRRASLLIDASALRVVASTAPGFSARLAGARVPLSVDPLGRMRGSGSSGGAGGGPGSG